MDIVPEIGKNQCNNLEILAVLHAIFHEIKAILGDVPLGKYRVHVSLQLRQAMIINSTLFSSDVRHGINSPNLMGS